MLTIQAARAIAATAWCQPATKDKVMDVDLAEAFAQLLIDNQFGQMAQRMHEEMEHEFPRNPDIARAAARVAIGILVEAQLR